MTEDATHSTALPGRPAGRPWRERLLGFFATIRPGEGKSALLFFSYAFLLLVCYYILKTLREPLLLTGASAELKSYAYAVIALILLFLVPLYGAVFRRTNHRQLVRGITVFFLANLLIFYLLGRAGIDIGFAYYVWVGIFSVAIIAQFWAHAADTYSVASGQRLFPVIMAGATLGALAGPTIARVLFPLIGPWYLMLVAVVLLAATLPLIRRTADAVPTESSNTEPPASATAPHDALGGFSLVLRDRYLMLLALMVVLLNCINSTGEYILTDFVLRYADEQVAAQPGLEKGNVIAAFYGNFFLAVNALTLFIQVFLVARILRWVGVYGALLILPVIAFIGYGLAVFVPIFGVIRLVKTFENSADYSLMNTTRQTLYLPLPAAEKFEGKTAIDTFFWRFGDLLQAGLIYAGLHWFGFGYQQFAMLNMVLAGVWIAVAVEIGKRYVRRTPAKNQPKRTPAWRLATRRIVS